MTPSINKPFFIFAALILYSDPSLFAEQPNIVIILADDLHRFDIGCFGAKNTKTPNIDSLAYEGIKFNQAYVAFAQCAPCRAELYSGSFPNRNGLIGNGIPSRSDITSIPLELRKLGYRAGLVGKGHVGPRDVYAFDFIYGKSSDKKKSDLLEDNFDSIREYISKDPAQPFFLAVCSHQPHKPWDKGDASTFDPDKLIIPPTYYDCIETREELCHYYAEVEFLDWQIGEVLKVLKESNKIENTLIIFLSEQGAHLPRAKFTSFDAGIHAGAIAKWPGKIAAGTSTDAIIHYADVLPTLIDIIGGKIPDEIDGKSFAGVLTGEKKSHREYAYGFTTSALPASTPGGYGMRAITDGRYKLIHNYHHDKTFDSPGLGGAFKAWVKYAAEDPEAAELTNMHEHRPAMELYDISKDPWELENRVDDPELVKIKKLLIKELDNWLKQQNDDPIQTEIKAVAGRNAKRIKAGKTLMHTESKTSSITDSEPLEDAPLSRKEARIKRKAVAAKAEAK
ncbi:MAG: hypothetical protein COA78_06250 [Blastopirellula sp.]|nr:MAG: hypothetical protein COA78_06250 [Blastopirellula sp.]